jgi:DNA-binding LacI/PurR family transcriptional regulator
LLSKFIFVFIGYLRVNGYKEALRKNNIKFEESLALLTDSDAGFDEKRSTLILDKKPDAILQLTNMP